jgi:hypothetical protein
MLLAACGSSAGSSAPISTTSTTSVPPSEVTSEDPLVWDFADGLYNYAGASYSEKAKILYQLEKYTLDNFLGGIPFADNAANVLYNSRLSIPSDVYVPNYGFGVGEGTIMDAMTAEQEPETKYQWYYHTWQQKDPGTVNYWDGQDSVTADLHAMINSSYYNTRFTADKTNYEWYNQLATERPIALNLRDDGMGTKWRVKVRTDAELKYRTLSTDPAVAAFDGQRVVLADYLTPFKMMLDNNLFRATDLGSATSGFKGAKEYAAAKAAGLDPEWSSVGIQINVAENAIDFEFVSPKTPFYAMYSLSTSLFSPVPEAFITAIGGITEYGKPNINSTLSLGMYVMEEWQSNKQIAFKKNNTYFERDKAHFAGYKYTILASATVAFQEFIAGKLDAATIPSSQLQAYKSDPRRRQTLGDTVWKLQVNATTEERYEELFGEEGSIYSHDAEDYWPHKPVMSNYNFLNGLYFSINRVELAEATGRFPAQAFLSDAYNIDPELGISFRSTDEGKAVTAERSPETQGFSVELAAAYFQAAMEELEEAGDYTPGTAEEPTVIELSLIYQTATQVATEGASMEGYLEDAFNAACPGYELDVQPYATSDWMDAYYAPMMGEFDLAFGSISGNTLDPVSFMDTVLSDNRTGFTLSWGVDTALPTQDLRYDGVAWSFQSLFEAATAGTIASEGAPTILFTIGDPTCVVGTEAGKHTVSVSGTWYNLLPDDVDVIFEAIGLYNYSTEVTTYYDVEEVLTKNADGTWTITFENVDLSTGAYWAVDIYYITTVQGVASATQNVYPMVPYPLA